MEAVCGWGVDAMNALASVTEVHDGKNLQWWTQAWPAGLDLPHPGAGFLGRATLSARVERRSQWYMCRHCRCHSYHCGTCISLSGPPHRGWLDRCWAWRRGKGQSGIQADFALSKLVPMGSDLWFPSPRSPRCKAIDPCLFCAQPKFSRFEGEEDRRHRRRGGTYKWTEARRVTQEVTLHRLMYRRRKLKVCPSQSHFRKNASNIGEDSSCSGVWYISVTCTYL